MQTTYDSSSGRLRILFSYSADLQDQDINVVVNLTTLNITSTLPPVTLALPANTQNNQALRLFSDATYSLAAATRTLALVVSVMTLLLFAVGYFGPSWWRWRLRLWCSWLRCCCSPSKTCPPPSPV